jgi:pimeloyl-ACP methyl ester carboxylesterase
LEALEDESLAQRPVVLVGYSLGGLVTTDLGCWLSQHSIPVAQLCFLDPDPCDSRMSALRRLKLRVGAGTRFRELRSRLGHRPHPPEATFQAHVGEVDTDALSRHLALAYLDGSVRLPNGPASCLVTRDSLARRGSATTLFGRPAELVDTTVVDLPHIGLPGMPYAVEVARWLDERLRSAHA